MTKNMKDVDLSRFIDAHKRDYDNALREIKNGKKYSHWMWYIFPQIKGLGRRSTSQYYAIENLDEAAAFLADPYLGNNLQSICEELLKLEISDAVDVFGRIDSKKLKSSMTLFSFVSRNSIPVFEEVIKKFFAGERDQRTIRILHDK